MKSIVTLFVLLFALVAQGASQFAVPPVNAPDNRLPVPGSVMLDPSNRPASYSVSGFFDVFTEVTLDFAGTPGVKPPLPGGAITQSLTGVASFHLSLDGGASTQVHNCPITATVRTTASSSSGETRFFDTEMLALALSGGSLPGTVMIRESPTLASTGQTAVRESPSRPSRIASFFDVFTELSIDGGQTWTPADGAIRLETKMLRGFAGVASPSCLPTGIYAGQITGDPDFDLLSLQHGTTPPPPLPPVGASATFSLGEMSVQLIAGSIDRTPVDVTASCRATGNYADGQTRCFDTEMLSLSLSGGTLPSGMMIRESPTRASLGRTTVRNTPGAPAEASSFFDVFLELSTDGGSSWTPQEPLTVEFADTLPSPSGTDLACEPVATYPTNLYPLSAGSSTISMRQRPASSLSVIRSSSVLTMRNFTMDPTAPQAPLPALGATQIYTVDEDGDVQVSLNTGLPFQDSHMSGSGFVRVTRTPDVGDTQTYQTEMLSLDLNSSSGMKLRESPTKQSLGRLSVAPNGGGYKINSFFDVFTEVSFDGGASWEPAAESLHLAQVLLPPMSTFPTAKFPPPGTYRVSLDRGSVDRESPSRCGATEFSNGALLLHSSFFDIFTDVALPAPGGSSSNPATGRFAASVSLDGGGSFFDVWGDFSMVVHVDATNHTPTQTYFDTEMLSLNIQTVPPPGVAGIMIRESPTLASTGGTHLRESPTVQKIGSFFDVFLELSVDGGSTWSPATSAMRIELDSVRSGVITGVKWHDADGNGVKDGGESGLANWTIALTDTNGTILDSAITDASGAYAFSHVPTGTYRVSEIGKSGWIQTGGAPAYGFWMVPGDTMSGNDFGNFQAPSLSGVKFDDQNGDGVRDLGDEGIKDWEICLFPKNVATPGAGVSSGTGAFTLHLNGLPPVVGTLSGYGAARKGYQHYQASSAPGVIQPRPTLKGYFENGKIPTEMLALELRSVAPVTIGGNPYNIVVKPDTTKPKREFVGHVSLLKTRTRPGGAAAGSSLHSSFFDVFLELEAMPNGSGPPVGPFYCEIILSADVDGDGTYEPLSKSLVYHSGPVTVYNALKEPAGTLDSLTFVVGDPASQVNPICTTTDGAGRYSFSPLLPGVWNLVEHQQPCWDMTTLPAPPILSTSGGTLPAYDFGNHERQGIVCVSKYYDINHNQQLDGGEPPMADVSFTLTGTNTLLAFTKATDAAGQVCFPNLPPDDYVLTESVPAGYTPSFPKSGIINATIAECESLSYTWLNSAALTDTLFRTATAEEWARALDLKQKHKAEKCKPDAVDFKFNLRLPFDGAHYQAGDGLTLKFNMPIDSLAVYSDKSKALQCGTLTTDAKRMLWHFDHFGCVSIGASGPVQFEGRGVKGSPIKVAYQWNVVNPVPPGGPLVLKGALPGKPNTDGDTLKLNVLRLPAPNLNNVGEEIYRQGGFPITVGAPADSHSVTHLKYADVQKSLYKDNKGILTLHTDSTHCLDQFVTNAKPILKQQKSLPPVKHNNALFAEVLALKLNLLASRLGKFPAGLDSLIYDDHKNVVNPTHPAFNGKHVEEIMAQADVMLACKADPKGAGLTPYDYYRVVRRINAAFSGPVDTARWSCDKIVLAGVRPLKSVAYLRADPGQSMMPVAYISGNSPVALAPDRFALDQNYPNPFNPTTTIRFTLPTESVVTLRIYNMLGQEVASLINAELLDEGESEVSFDASSLPSGVYIYKLVVQDASGNGGGAPGASVTSMKKMVLIK